MYKKYLLKLEMIILIIIPGLFSTELMGQRLNNDLAKEENSNFFKIRSQVYESWNDIPESEIKGFKQFKRWEYFWQQRTYPSGNFPEGIQLLKSYQAYENSSKDNLNFLSVKWTPLGPFSEPKAATGQQGIGRVNAVRFNPLNQNELWAASASGGIWKSSDGGDSWGTFPFTQFLSLGVTDIGIAPSNPNIIYASTGDMFGSTSNRNFYSIGVIKTTDGGANWNITSLNHELAEKVLFGRVLVHPNNPKLVYVASSKGIFKSIDGGNTWKISEKFVHFMDMEFKPQNPDVIYASSFSNSGSTGVYVSNDAGETWNRTLMVSNGVRIAIATTQANPEKLYALAANTSTFGFNSLQVSEDSGQTWTIKSSVESNVNILGWYTGNPGSDTKGQGFYDLCIAASPENENEIFTGGINIWKSVNGGETFVKVTNWFPQQGMPYVHADQHDLIFAPDGKTLYAGNDGGIVSTSNKGGSWITKSNGMNISQYYRIGVSQSQSDVVIAGAQDNGSSLFKSNNWAKVYNSDGMECIIDSENSQRMYASIYNGSLHRSNDGGANFSSILSTSITKESGAWVTPYVLNPQNQRSIYAGYTNVWKSENYGNKGSWVKISQINPSSTLQSLAVAPSDSNVIYTASVNQLFATYDGGKSWAMIHTSGTYITYIAVDPKNPRRVWVSKSGFNENEKVLEIIDSTVVRNLSGNLPNVPVNTIVVQDDSPDRLYIGTDIGVFVSDYNSAYWEKYGSDMPNVIVNELEIHKGENKLYASTYGRGLWSAPLINCTANQPEIEVVNFTKFCPGDTVVIKAKQNYPNYTWSNGARTNEIKVTKPGYYSLFVTDNNGCIGRSESFILPKSPLDQIDVIRVEDEFLCPDGELQLSATLGFDEYLWSDGTKNRTIIIKEPGFYGVNGVTPDGCVVESKLEYFDIKPAPEKPTISQEGRNLTSSYGSKYQWYLDGKRLFSETERVLYIKDGKIGEYTVLVYNEFNCTALSDSYSIVTSVENNIYNDYEISVSNNPGDGNFVLDFSSSIIGNISINITDVNGREVYLETSDFGTIKSYSLDLSQLSAGIYFAKISANKFVKLVKLIKI